MENTWKKKYKISLKSIFFLFPCIIFKVNFQLWGHYNTLSMMCILVTGLKWRPQGGIQNKQIASVRLYWRSSPLTGFGPLTYPVSASVQSTISTKVFDALVMPYSSWWPSTWSNDDLLSVGPLGTDFIEIFLSKYKNFRLKNTFQNVVCRTLSILFLLVLNPVWNCAHSFLVFGHLTAIKKITVNL